MAESIADLATWSRSFHAESPANPGILTTRTEAFISELSILVKYPGAGSLLCREGSPHRPRQASSA